MTTPWSAPRDWEGETVAVLAAGPSMSPVIGETVRGRCRVIAVNNSGIDTWTTEGKLMPAPAPWADVLYAADVKWWDAHKNEALHFAGDKVTIRTALPYPQVKSLEFSTNVPFDPRPTHLVSGGNSGYQAVHLAAHLGARRILLCGFDMRDVNGKRHWFGSYVNKRLNSQPDYRRWIENFRELGVALQALGIEVVNCTPKSALSGFDRKTLEEAIHA